MPAPQILIASAPHADTFGYSMPPPGLLRLGGALRAAGCSVALLDLAHELAAGRLPGDDQLADAAAARLLEHEPQCLGLSVMGATLPIALAIAERVAQQRPGLPILLGGPGTTGIDRALLERFPYLTGVVRGEGEQTLLELLTALQWGPLDTPLAGATLRGPGGQLLRGPDRAPLEDLGQLAAYAYDLLPSIADYKRITGAADGLVPIDSGRGCVYDCSFCTIGRFWGRRSRTLPPARLVAEIAALAHMPGARSAYLCHDLFGADRRQALAFCQHMQTAGVRVPFEIRARLDHLDDELIAALSAAGCYRVLLGIESADGALRNLHQKRMDPSLPVLERIQALLAKRIVPILSLIVGLPGEDEAALERTLELALRASLLGGVQLSFHLVNPQPGCGLYETHGASSVPVEGIPPDMALGAGQTAAERALIAAHPDLFSTFALLTGLPGGVTQLLELHRLSRDFAPLIERFPHCLALGLRLTGQRPLAFFRELCASGRSLAAWVAQQQALLGQPLLGALFHWEQARLRQAARSGAAPSASDQPSAPRPRGEVVELGVDPLALRRCLDAPISEPLTLPPNKPHWLLVSADAGGITSRSISAQVAAILARLDGRFPAELEAETPGLGMALARLAELGLLENWTSPTPAPAQA
jgi:hypothetical protein